MTSDKPNDDELLKVLYDFGQGKYGDPKDKGLKVASTKLNQYCKKREVAVIQTILNTCKYEGRELFLSTSAVEQMLEDLKNDDDSHKVLTAVNKALKEQTND